MCCLWSRRRKRKTNISCFPPSQSTSTHGKRQKKSSGGKGSDNEDDDEEDDDDDDNGSSSREQTQTTQLDSSDVVWVRSYLNITSAMHAADGFVCVAVETSCVRLRNAKKDIQNLYVAPQHLRLVRNFDDAAKEAWQDAVPYIVISE